MSDHLDEIKAAAIDGRYREIDDLVKTAIEDNIDINKIVNDAMIAAMDPGGKRFAEHNIFVPRCSFQPSP